MISETERQELSEILSDLLDSDLVQSMKCYIQHGTVSTFDHAMRVTERCYERSRRMPAEKRRKLLRAAFLHDFYLYDWHTKDPSHKWHGFHHARRAANNAKAVFHVSEEECRMIDRHMWPLNPERIPMTKSEWILTLVDKRVSFAETWQGFFKKKSPAGKENEKETAMRS